MEERYFIVPEVLLEFAVLRQSGISIEKPDAHGIVGDHGRFYPS